MYLYYVFLIRIKWQISISELLLASMKITLNNVGFFTVQNGKLSTQQRKLLWLLKNYLQVVNRTGNKLHITKNQKKHVVYNSSQQYFLSHLLGYILLFQIGMQCFRKVFTMSRTSCHSKIQDVINPHMSVDHKMYMNYLAEEGQRAESSLQLLSSICMPREAFKFSASHK